jgi:hypothetical protein
MIQNFFNTVQQDFINVAKSFNSSNPRMNSIQEKKVHLSAIRLLASFGMLVGAVCAFKAVLIVAVAPLSALFGLALGAALYAAGHDVFIMAKRATDDLNPLNAVVNQGRGIINDLGNLFSGNTNRVGQGNISNRTNGTFFQPLWNSVLVR